MYDLGLILCIFTVAILYSSVGHAGASGYLASMAIFSVAPDSMRPAALVLNILVAMITATRFYWAGYFSWAIFWPFAITSIPCAYLGGRIALPSDVYRQLIGALLLFAAYRLFRKPTSDTERPAPLAVALVCGSVLGFMAGLTGTGGGIFLSPLLLLVGWAKTKTASSVSATFILVNSVAGMIGLLTQGIVLPAQLPYWIIAVVIGGAIGAELGSKRLPNPTVRRLLAVVLVVAAMKLIFT